MKKYHVLIVGAGPAGLLLAHELTKYGVSVKIIEQSAERTNHSKALSLSSASLQVFHGMNLAPAFLKAGRVVHDIHLYYNQKRTLRINKRYLNSLYNFYLSMPQPVTEQIIENDLKSKNIAVNYQSQLISFLQEKDQVYVTVKDLESGLETQESVDFLIGCDGARSTVRNLLSLPFTGKDYPMHFIMGDVYFSHSLTQKTYSPETYYYIDQTGFIIILPMQDGLTRIIIKKNGPLPYTGYKPNVEELQFYLNKYVPAAPQIKNIVWGSSAHFFNRIASTNRVNRVFLAGDSWHLFSPIGGQGMNTGIQDAFNLGWKLAYFIKGNATPALLDSYVDERMRAVKKVLSSTDLNTELIASISHEHEKINAFKPSFANRKYYRTALVDEFAGFLADYSNSENPEGKLAGKNVPYIKFNNTHHKMSTTFDIPQKGKNILFINEKEYSSFSHYHPEILEIIPIPPCEDAFIKKFNLYENRVCIVRPDGYIAYNGDKEGVLHYLNKFFVATQPILNIPQKIRKTHGSA